MAVFLATPAGHKWNSKTPEIRRDGTRPELPSVGQFFLPVQKSDTTNDVQPPAAQSSLGTLDVFPLEILQMILSDLDITSLVNFRAASRDSKTVVESISTFKTIYTLAPRVLQAVHAFGAGSWLTCQDLRGALSNNTCATCDEYGGFIYLFSCTRVCAQCITRSPEYPTALTGFAKFLCDLDDQTLRTLRTITIPEQEQCPDTIHRPLALVNRNDAIKVGVRLHGHRSLVHKFMVDHHSDDGDDESGQDMDIDDDQSESDDGASVTESTISLEKADLISGMTFYAGAVRAPEIDFITKKVEWGSCCSSCTKTGRQGRSKMEWDDVGGERYASYLQECGGAKAILSCLDYCQHVARSAAAGYVPMISEDDFYGD